MFAALCAKQNRPYDVPVAGGRIGRKVLLGVLSRGLEIASDGRPACGRSWKRTRQPQQLRIAYVSGSDSARRALPLFHRVGVWRISQPEGLHRAE